jgi:signal transduction histidine kinase
MDGGEAGTPPVIERPQAAGETAAPIAPRRRLVRKYALLLIGLVGAALLLSSGFDFWFSYRENQAALIRVQQEKAAAAARRVEGFIGEIERQIGWTTQALWALGSLDQRRFDYVRLLHQVPAITELSQLDAAGQERLKVSRLAIDVVDSGADLSQSPPFVGAKAKGVWFSPVYFHKQSEPYMTLAVRHAGRSGGVTVAEINLKLLFDVITAMKIGQSGYAYVVDGSGKLIAHPDISLVLRDTDLSKLPQIAAALHAPAADPAATAGVAENIGGRAVLAAHATIAPLGWLVFVEVPLKEAFAPLYGQAARSLVLLIAGMIVAAVAAVLLARRLTGPIRALQEGAARIGAGELSRRIDIRTGDELEGLAERFNDMAADLQKSYAELERRVEERTAELAEALEQQTATAEVLGVINASPGDLAPVFEAMLEKAMRLCEGSQGALWTFDAGSTHLAASRGLSDDLIEALRQGREHHELSPNDPIWRIMHEGQRLIQVADAAADRSHGSVVSAGGNIGGLHTMIFVALLKDAAPVGAFAIARQEIRPFTDKQIALLQNFAAQAVIAIENARLLDELRERTDELARSVEELKALGEVGQAVSSTLDLDAVLATILNRSVGLTGSDAGAIFRYRRAARAFRLFDAVGWDEALVAEVRKLNIAEEVTAIGEATARRWPIQIADLQSRASNPLRDVNLAAGYRSALIVPLVGADRVFGAIVLQRRTPGEFPEATVRLMQTLAAQSVLAIQNARLFREIAEKSEQLAEASRHKSQFLANMSHELRTPLNAILGYTELMADGIYGELPPRAAGVLERVQNNGKHLLALINDVLDLSKIEAGQLTLSLEDYALPDVVRSVVSATEGLANTKGLKFTANVAAGLPIGRGDARRLSQVLLNLVGNAVKFTDSGEVAIGAMVEDGHFVLTVRDTGPGIAPEDQAKIFEEFQQVDNSNTRKKGGTGLGLAISRRMVEMQGGTISVNSELGKGATFRVTLPVRVKEAAEELMGAA